MGCGNASVVVVAAIVVLVVVGACVVVAGNDEVVVAAWLVGGAIVDAVSADWPLPSPLPLRLPSPQLTNKMVMSENAIVRVLIVSVCHRGQVNA
jgi:hypothetical protein